MTTQSPPSSSSTSRPPPIQTTFSSSSSSSSPPFTTRNDRPRAPHHLSNPSSAHTTPKTPPRSVRFNRSTSNPTSNTAQVAASASASSSSSSAAADPLLSRLTPTTINKMSDQDFLPGEKEVGVWAASAAEKIEWWLEEVDSWELLTFWEKTDGEGFRIPSTTRARKKRRKVDLEAARNGVRGVPVARRLFTDIISAAAATSSSTSTNTTNTTNTYAGKSKGVTNGITMPSLKLDNKKHKDAISMSQIDELLSPTTTPLIVKRLDLDGFHNHNGASSPMTPGRYNNGNNNNGPLSPFFSPYDGGNKLPKRRSLQVAGIGLGISTMPGTPTTLKRQTFDFATATREREGLKRSMSSGGAGLGGGAGPAGGYRPSSSPTKSAPMDGNPFANVGMMGPPPLPPTSHPIQQQSPKVDITAATTDSEADLTQTSSSESEADSDPLSELTFLGSMTHKTLDYISTRITDISTDLSHLDIEGLKSRVLHFKAQQIDELGNGRMSDSLAIITATTLQLLPRLHRLWGLLEGWGVRVEVCRVVPTFLAGLERAEGVVNHHNNNNLAFLTDDREDEGERWLEEIEEGVSEDAVQEGTLRTLERGVDVVWEKRKAEVVEMVGVCGKIIDGMLDLLEGREETVPEEWIDRLEAVEAALEGWVLGEENKAQGLKRRWREVAFKRKVEEEMAWVERERVRRLQEEERRKEEARLAEVERLRREEEEKLKREEEERLRLEEEERLRREEEERIKREEEERVLRLEQERLRLEEEERRSKLEEQKRLAAEAEERAAKEAEAKRRKQEEDERLRLAYLEQVKRDEEEKRKRLAAEEFERKLAEEEAERRKAEEQRIREIEERMMRKYEEMERAAEEEERRKAEAASMEALSTEETSTEAISTEEISTEAISTEEISTEAVSTEAVSTEAISTEAISTDEASPDAESPMVAEPVVIVAATKDQEPIMVLAPVLQTEALQNSFASAQISADSGPVNVLPLISEDAEAEAEAEGESEPIIKNISTLLETEPALEPGREPLKLSMPPQMMVPLLTPIAEEKLTPLLAISDPMHEVELAVIEAEPEVSVVEDEPRSTNTPSSDEHEPAIAVALVEDNTSGEVQDEPEGQVVDATPSEPLGEIQQPAHQELEDDQDIISGLETEVQLLTIAEVEDPLVESGTAPAGSKDAAEDTIIIDSEESIPPSPAVSAQEISVETVSEDILSVSPLLTPALPKSISDVSKEQPDIVVDAERPISPVLSLLESASVPVLKIQAATPIEGRHGSVAFELASVASQLGKFPSTDLEDEFGEPEVKVVISEDSEILTPITGDALAASVPQAEEIVEIRPLDTKTGEPEIVQAQSPPRAKSPTGALEETILATVEPPSQPSPYLAPTAAVGDDYVSDIDDSDVATEADDEEFQEELRKERLGQDPAFSEASSSPILPTTTAKSPRKSTTEKINGEVHESDDEATKTADTEELLTEQSEGPPGVIHQNVKYVVDATGGRSHLDFFDKTPKKTPAQSFNSVQSLEVSREDTSQLSLSPTGSVIHHRLDDDSFGQSFTSVRSEDTVPDGIGPEITIDEPVADPEPQTPTIEEEEVSPIKEEFDDFQHKSPAGGQTLENRLQAPEFAVDGKKKGNTIPRTGSRAQEQRPAWNLPALPKTRQPSVSSVSSTSSKGSDAASRPARSQGIRRVSSIPSIAPPRTQAHKEVKTQDGRSTPQFQRPSHIPSQPSRSSSRQSLRPDSRLSGIPRKASSSQLAEDSAALGMHRKASSNNLAADTGRGVVRKASSSHLPPAAVPARTSSANKTDPTLVKKRSSISGISSREIAPKTSAQELRNIPSRASSRIGSRPSLRGQGSTQSLRSLPSPTLTRDPTSPLFDTALRGQGSRSSLRGFQLPTQTPQQSSIRPFSHQISHHASSPTYEANQTIKVVKRKNNLGTKPPSAANEKGRENGTKLPVTSTPDFPALRHVHNPPGTPMKGKELEDRLELKINTILIGLPTLTMTPSPMKKPVPPPINTAIEPPKPQKFGESKLPISRTPSTPTIGQAPNLTVSSKRTISQPGEVKMYHLHKSDEESPVKLFVRLVGDKGERVMVRVGGGWADLKEYLIEYASHHGIQGQRKTLNESVVEFGDDARSLRASGSNSSMRSSYRGSPTPTFGNSRPSSPLAVRNTPGRAESPYSSRKQESPRYSYTNDRTQPRGSPITPKFERPVTPGSAGLHPTYSSPGQNPDRLSTGFRRPTSRLSFGDYPDTAELPSGMPLIPSVPLGLAGPKSRNLEISAEKQAWVDGMLGQVRKASAERNVRLGFPRTGSTTSLQSGGDDDSAIGSGPRLTDMGRVGSTRRMYATKPPSILGMQKGAKGSSSSLRLSESGRDGDSGKQNSGRSG